jgi:hypothetical protein
MASRSRLSIMPSGDTPALAIGGVATVLPVRRVLRIRPVEAIGIRE